MTKQPVGIPHRNPLDYTGPNKNIVPIQGFSRRPLPTDRKYNLGQVVILGKNPSTGVAGELWYLARFEANGDAVWIQFTTGGTGINFLESDDGPPPVGPDGSSIVDVLGGTGITTSGQDPSTTLTIAVDGNVVTTQYDGDVGTAVPAAGILNIVGSTGLDTSAAGNTLTVNLDGNVVTTQYDADAGSAVPVAGILNVVGSAGLDTSAIGNTLTVNLDGNVVGQTITGDSGGALSPTGGNWNIIGSTGIDTSGAVSTLTINLDGNVVTTQYDADSGSATPSAGILNIIGGNGTVTSAAGNTVIAEMESPFVGNFSFESNTGGVVATLTVQNTVDAASSAAILDIKIAGGSSDYSQWRVANEGLGSFSGAINAAGDSYSLNYLDDATVTPATASNQIFRIDDIDIITGVSRLVKRSHLAVAEEGTGLCLLQMNATGNAVDTVLQFTQLSGTNDARINFNMAGFNWGLGVDATAANDFYITQATIAEWPPSAANTIIHIEKEITGTVFLEQTGAIKVPVGTTAERPAAAIIGMIRYNTTTGRFEGYDGAWGNL